MPPWGLTEIFRSKGSYFDCILQICPFGKPDQPQICAFFKLTHYRRLSWRPLSFRVARPAAAAGPRMSLSPDNSFRFFEDFYAVPSTASESNDGCLLYFVPKNGGRFFDVHKNRLLAHIGAFDPVHLRLLLCAKHTTGARRTRPSRANKFKLRHYLIS